MRETPRDSSSIWPILAAVLALLAIPGVFTLSRVFFVRDLTTSFLPHHLWFHETLFEGHLPLWNPYPGSGYSTVGDPAFETLFPLTLPLRLLPPYLGFNLFVALPFPLAALGMYFFLRHRVSSPAACLGATVVAASGAFLSTANTPNLAWSCALIPWILLGADAVARRPSAQSTAALAAGCALMILAGEPVTFAATAALALLYVVLVGGAPAETWRPRARAMAVTVAAIVLGILLGAVQILPLLDLHGRSIRATGALIDSWSLHPARLVETVMPYFFGKWVGMPDEVTQWLFALNDGREPLLLSLYVGAGAVLLALTGALAARDRRWAYFWCLVLVLGVVAAFGDFTPLYPAARRAFPLLAVFRFPSKHTLFATLALGALAALGFDALTRRDGGPWLRRSVPWLLACVMAGTAATGVLVALARPAAVLALLERLGHAWSLPNPSTAASSFLGRVGAGAPHLLIVAGMSGLCLWLCGRRDGDRALRTARIARALLFAIVAGDLLATNASINPTIDASALEPFEWVERTREHPGDRVFVALNFSKGLTPMDDAVEPPPYPADISPVVHQALYETVLCNFWACGPLRRTLSTDLTGLRPREYLTLLEAFTAADRAARYRFLSSAGTRYFLAAAPPPLAAVELTRLPKLGDLALYEVPPSGGRVAVVSAAEIEPDLDRQVRRLFDAGFDPAITVVIDREPDGPSGQPGSPMPPRAAIVEESGATVVIDAAAPETAYLVLKDAYDPHWSVQVDGEAAQLLRANGVFRAVRLPPGRHRVRFSYFPRPLWLGGLISLLTALGLGMWVRARSTSPL